MFTITSGYGFQIISRLISSSEEAPHIAIVSFSSAPKRSISSLAPSSAPPYTAVTKGRQISTCLLYTSRCV